MSGGSTISDILGGLQTAGGAVATVMGNPAIGIPLMTSGMGGLTGQQGAQPGAQQAAQAATGAATQQNPLQQVSQMAPAAQSIMNAMGLNPNQRPQGATAPPTGLQTPPSAGRQAQAFNLPQMQQPVQAAGAMGNVPAGAGSSAPASAGAGMNPQLQQILAMLGRPY